MMVARHFRRRLLILSVATLGFFISSFSAVLASDFSGPVVSVLDGDITVHLRCGGCVLPPVTHRVCSSPFGDEAITESLKSANCRFVSASFSE